MHSPRPGCSSSASSLTPSSSPASSGRRSRPSLSLRLPLLLCLLCLCLLLPLLPSSAAAAEDDDVDEDDEHAEDYGWLTYGSAVRLRHVSSGYHLHSHGISYGSGSGQQSVTAVSAEDDAGSLWQVKEAHRTPTQPIGSPVRCGEVVRLQHVTTRRYLHSHLHASPLTNKQEVSGYGEGSHSDSGDNWRVDCHPTSASVGSPIPLPSSPDAPSPLSISLAHVDTGKRLYSRRQDEFTNHNCRGCPIIGQLEISATQATPTDAPAQWSIPHSGVLFPIKTDAAAPAISAAGEGRGS